MNEAETTIEVQAQIIARLRVEKQQLESIIRSMQKLEASEPPAKMPRKKQNGGAVKKAATVR